MGESNNEACCNKDTEISGELKALLKEPTLRYDSPKKKVRSKRQSTNASTIGSSAEEEQNKALLGIDGKNDNVTVDTETPLKGQTPRRNKPKKKVCLTISSTT